MDPTDGIRRLCIHHTVGMPWKWLVSSFCQRVSPRRLKSWHQYVFLCPVWIGRLHETTITQSHNHTITRHDHTITLTRALHDPLTLIKCLSSDTLTMLTLMKFLLGDKFASLALMQRLSSDKLAPSWNVFWIEYGLRNPSHPLVFNLEYWPPPPPPPGGKK